MPHTAIAWPCFSRGLMSSRIDCDSGTSEAPKIPCSKRDATICVSVSDKPHSAEATVKPPIEKISSRLTLSRSDSQPVSGVAIAAATIYEVSTHVISSCDADSVPCMCGSATLAMVLSSVWISVASMIETVIIGRLSGAAVLVGEETEDMDERGRRYSKHAYYIGCANARHRELCGG